MALPLHAHQFSLAGQVSHAALQSPRSPDLGEVIQGSLAIPPPLFSPFLLRVPPRTTSTFFPPLSRGVEFPPIRILQEPFFLVPTRPRRWSPTPPINGPPALSAMECCITSGGAFFSPSAFPSPFSLFCVRSLSSSMSYPSNPYPTKQWVTHSSR